MKEGISKGKIRKEDEEEAIKEREIEGVGQRGRYITVVEEDSNKGKKKGEILKKCR